MIKKEIITETKPWGYWRLDGAKRVRTVNEITVKYGVFGMRKKCTQYLEKDYGNGVVVRRVVDKYRLL